MGPFEFVLALFTITGLFLLLIVRAFVGRRRSDTLGVDETRLMQELHHGMTRLESRVETLETLLLERTNPPPPFGRTAYREAVREKE